MAQPIRSPYGSRRRVALTLLYTSRGSFPRGRRVQRVGSCGLSLVAEPKSSLDKSGRRGGNPAFPLSREAPRVERAPRVAVEAPFLVDVGDHLLPVRRRLAKHDRIRRLPPGPRLSEAGAEPLP
jgi:hypothetical protein